MSLLKNVRSLIAPIVLLAAAALLAPVASAQAPPISDVFSTNPSSVAAGAPGIAGLQVNASGGYSPTEFNVCVYSSYGGSAPIAPDSTQTFSGAIELTVDVPASTIQAVPPTAFTSDTAYPEPYFLLQVYLVTTGVTTCTGTPPSGETASTLAIEYPVLNNISTSNIPEQNPNLTGRVPSNLNLAGQNFLGSPIGSSPSSVTSTVNYATTSYSGSNTALYVSQRSVRSSLPVNIPSSVTSLEVSVCNAATYTYCSASQALYLYTLAADTGTVTANPAAPASSSVPVTLSSQFGATPFSAQAGAPGGLVTFTDGPTTLGKAKLLLDTTAQFLQIPSDGDNSTFTTNTGSPVSSFVADFNQDGVPDSMFVDGSAAVFHIILGLPPYAIDNPVSVTETTSCSTILSAAVADFNNDGIPDIAFACTSFDGNIYYAMLGLGDGSTFATPIQITAPNLPYPMLAAADFNKDGKVDLVIASTLDSVVSFTVLTGDGTGHFTAGSPQDPTAVGTVNQFLAADLNGDGAPDLLVGTSNGTDAFQNDGTGNFGGAITVDGQSFASILLSRFGPGQLPSLILVDSQKGQVDFDQNTSTGGVISFANTAYDITVPGVLSAAAGDFNGDGYTDVAVSTTTGISVYTGNGTAEGFLAGTSYTGLADPYAGGNLLVGAVDENGDGYADLLSLGSSNNGSSITYYETGYITAGTASATLGTQPTFATGAHTITATTPGTYTTAGGSATTSVTVPVTLMPGNITLTATPVSPATYGATITLTAQINGTPAPTGVVTFADGATTLGTASLTTPSPGVNIATLNAGILGAATHNFTATYPGDANYTSGSGTLSNYVIQQATPTTTWAPRSATIVYGTALSGAQLDAASPVAGSFAYTPAVGAVLTAGPHTLTAVFTPTDTIDYKSVTTTTSITVTRAAPATFWTPSPDTITYGAALSGSQLDATSPVAGTFAYSPASGAVLAVGTQTLTAVFTPTDAIDYQPVTITSRITVTPASTSITWVPNPATIVYGTALSAAQLDAASAIAGSFTYTPALGAVLTAGPQTLTALFTPTDTKDYKPVTVSATITVTQATPIITWPAPAGIVAGTPLSSTQLDAKATGLGGAALPGNLVYTPALGAILSAGQQQLSVAFTPIDAVDYTSTSATVPITVVSAGLVSITPSTAVLGSAATTITITGSGFASNSIVLVNGTAVATTYAGPTTLTATIPASDFLTVQTFQISVKDPTPNQTTNSLPFTVTAPAPAVVLSGPSTTAPGDEPQITFQLANPYPVALSGTLVLTFTPADGSPDDPMVRFASTGTDTTDPTGRTMTFTIAANSTDTPPVMIQSGSVAGAITITLTLNAGAANVTPAGLTPVVITDANAVPGITSVSMSASGKVLTVVVVGYSNTREVAQALFTFTPATGQSLKTTSLTVDDTTLFSTWYSSATSDQYGSTFTYTQTFDIDEDATVVGGVGVTLVNSIGNSTSASTPTSTAGSTP